ncbi:hypothetical protein F4824DRAFT_108218 [Ustulina deusta]|nr:hypothetical protein F4824DRAFT_108218 [Ustulina deusta]
MSKKMICLSALHHCLILYVCPPPGLQAGAILILRAETAVSLHNIPDPTMETPYRPNIILPSHVSQISDEVGCVSPGRSLPARLSVNFRDHIIHVTETASFGDSSHQTNLFHGRIPSPRVWNIETVYQAVQGPTSVMGVT